MKRNRNSPFRLLMLKDIYAILDGDTEFEEYEFSDDGTKKNISMPYLRGSDLRTISNIFGLPVRYSSVEGPVLSRWQYLDNLFEHCVAENCCSALLLYLFDKKQFAEMFKGHDAKVIDEAYTHYMKVIIGRINGILCFAGNELVLIGNNFVVRKIGDSVGLETPTIKNIDSEYIKDISLRALKDVDNKEYDSAITKARTMLEEAFCYVIELKGEEPSKSGNIHVLYKQVKDLYKMHTNKEIDIRINKLLSGLESIVSAIAEMRNTDSDAHGVGSARIAIEERHARLLVNSATTMAEFVLSVGIENNDK